jgi:ParB family transcriptional regulator, chromosome partitioning protein
MKNAPTLTGSNEKKPTAPTPAPTSTPAAPTVSRVAREPIKTMRAGDTYKAPVCGRMVTFTLRLIPAAEVATKTRVWKNNERLQEFLNEKSLADIIPSMRENGQDVPAYGRPLDGGEVETADGSRRRAAAIITARDYMVWVGDLTDAEMDHFTKIGNQYTPTSAYERGRRYKQLLEANAYANQRELAEAEGITHKVIQRCIATASLPDEIIKLFPRLNDLSARAGETLAKNRNTHMLAAAKKMAKTPPEPEQLVSLLVSASNPPKEAAARQWSEKHWSIKSEPGKGLQIQLQDEIPEKIRQKIAEFIKKQLADQQ